MANFALDTSSPTGDIISSLNYALTNLGTSNANVLTANPDGSVINSTTGYVNNWQYRYINVRYATNATGSSGFSTSPTGATYYGIQNSADQTPATVNNPASYTWTQLSGGFGTSKYLFYSTLGGYRIQFYIGTSTPGTGYVQTIPGQAIDLSVLTVQSASASNGTTASVNPSIVIFPQNGNLTYPIGNTLITSTFAANANSIRTSSLFANINTQGLVTIQQVTTDPTINVTTTNSNTTANVLTITFSQPSSSTAVTSVVTVQVNGAAGNAQSFNSFTVWALANTQPGTPTANTGSYNFATLTATAPTGGNVTWTTTQPTVGITNAVYSSSTTAVTPVGNPSANVTTLTWTTPVVLAAPAPPTMIVTYPNGQAITDNQGVFTPTPVGNIVTLTANIQATRSNVILAAVTQNTQYFTANGAFNLVSNVSSGYNANALVFSTPTISGYNVYQNITYTDVGGTVTSFINETLQVTTTGNIGPRGFVPLAYIVANTNPLTANTAVLNAMFTANRTNVVAPIGVGYPPIALDTAQFYFANLAYPNAAVTSVQQYDGSSWTPVTAQVVSGDIIVTGTITAEQLNVNDIYTLDLASTTAYNQFGNTNSLGFWLNGVNGDAHFAGNTTIGGNLTISNLFSGGQLNPGTVGTTQISNGSITTGKIAANTITGNLIQAGTITGNLIAANTITGNNIVAGSITANQINANGLVVSTVVSTGATIDNYASSGFWLDGVTGNARFGNTVSIGNNLTVGQNANIGDSLTVGNYAQISNNLTVGNNLNIGQNAQIGGNLNVTGLITAGSLQANTVTGGTSGQIQGNTVTYYNLSSSLQSILPASPGLIYYPHGNAVSFSAGSTANYDVGYNSVAGGYVSTIAYVAIPFMFRQYGPRFVAANFTCNLTWSWADWPTTEGNMQFRYYWNGLGNNSSGLISLPTYPQVNNNSEINFSNDYQWSAYGAGTSSYYCTQANITLQPSNFYYPGIDGEPVEPPEYQTNVYFGIAFVCGNTSANNPRGTVTISNMQFQPYLGVSNNSGLVE